MKSVTSHRVSFYIVSLPCHVLNNLSDSRLSYSLTFLTILSVPSSFLLGFLHCHRFPSLLPWDWIFITLLILNKPRNSQLDGIWLKTRFTTAWWAPACCLLPLPSLSEFDISTSALSGPGRSRYNSELSCSYKCQRVVTQNDLGIAQWGKACRRGNTLSL